MNHKREDTILLNKSKANITGTLSPTGKASPRLSRMRTEEHGQHE